MDGHHIRRGIDQCLRDTGQKARKIKMVVNGAGAAAVSCSKIYLSLGVKKENLVMFDINGLITPSAPTLTKCGMQFATDRKDIKTLADAMKGADVFIGLSAGNVVNAGNAEGNGQKPYRFCDGQPGSRDRL